MRKIITIAFMIICLCVMGYSGYRYFTLEKEYKISEKEYEELEQFVDFGAETQQAQIKVGVPAGGKTQDGSTEAGEEARTITVTFPDVDVDGLAAENPDFVGYLVAPDTRISYPVVQGKDNSYYLHRSFKKTYNFAGCIFMDSECMRDMTDFNSILYGHHMRNGSMFASLMSYKKQDYYNEHPYMLYMTPESNYAILIFAGFVSDTKSDAWKQTFESDQEKQEWLDWLRKKSSFDSTLIPSVTDHIMTLSTCSYEFSNARYVLYGILVDCGK